MATWLKAHKQPLLLALYLIVFLALFGTLLWSFGKLGNSESFNVVLGIVLGVLAGGFIDLIKKEWDKYQDKEQLRLTAMKVLEQDAKSIFRLFEMYDGVMKAKDHPSAPAGLENYLPPALEMKYWERLSNKDEFLLLATEPRFVEIFRSFWDFEKLARLINEAQDRSNEEQAKHAYMFAMTFSRQTLEDRSHEALLSLFLTPKELADYKVNWRKSSALAQAEQPPNN